MSIVEFILARIAEDEAIGWGVVADAIGRYSAVEAQAIISDAEMQGEHSHASVGVARVLRECEAKRRIVAAHRDVIGDIETTHPCDGTLGVIECDTLRALASAYADHPDFDPAWA